MIRRHTRTGQKVRYTPGVQVVTGNYITAKKRGALNGTNFGYTGKVRFVQVHAIREQLNAGNIVILGNLGYSSAGELLNCNSYDVATHTAVELRADKLICLTGEKVAQLGLPFWMPLADAEEFIMVRYCQTWSDAEECRLRDPLYLASVHSDTDDDALMGPGTEFDLDDWNAVGLPTSVVAAVAACKNGVKRTHLVDAQTDGALLIELFSQEGFGTMFSQDLYSGIRAATDPDCDAIGELLALLRRDGIGVDRWDDPDEIASSLKEMTVAECDGQVVAAAWLKNLGRAPDGIKCAELLAFIVHPTYRNAGRGDSLLDFVEQTSREQGIRRLIMCSNKAIDWFEQRQFQLLDLQQEVQLLPPERWKSINPNHQQQLYTKTINELEAEVAAPAGKRIGY